MKEKSRHCQDPDCAAVLVRRHGESKYDWTWRRFCSQRCARKVFRANGLNLRKRVEE